MTVLTFPRLSRRAALRIGGLTAAGAFSRGARTALADDVAPIDRGNVAAGKADFQPIAAANEAREDTGEPPLAPSQRVGFAVVALGRLTVEQIIPAFAQTKKCKLAALVSGSPDKLKAIGAQCGLPAESLYSYDDFERIAQNDAVKVIYIVLPNSMHKDFVLRSARIKKHILCEKPMATSIADAKEMIAVCREAAIKLMIAYRCRYQPHHLEIIKRAQSGAYGPIKLIEAINAQNQGDPSQWRLKKALAGGGALPDVGIYCLNAARAVTGEEPVEVTAQMHSTAGDPRFREVEESVTWLMRFPSGALANLSTSYGIHRASSMTVNCDGGGLLLENAFPYKAQRLHIISAVEGKETDTTVQIAAKDHFALEMDHMADCVLNNLVPRTPGEEGLLDMIIMDAIYRSATSRTSVAL